MKINKHGLRRYIPTEIKRLVRRRSGFGCVICGLGFYEYEHVDPEFNDTKEHDPYKITLLCPNCHGKVTTKKWTKDKVRAAMMNPKNFSTSTVKDIFDIGENELTVIWGDTSFTGSHQIINIEGKGVLKFEVCKESKKWLLSGRFNNSKGELALIIEKNEWIGYLDNWDINVEGQSIVIREKSKHICLHLIVDPPNILIIKQSDVNYGNLRIVTKGKSTIFYNNKMEPSLTLSNNVFSNNFIDILIDNNPFN
ncbi:MAG: hypothetical protein BGO31_04060 [Bacteroidetes bacterium 43-16]|nr:MAG: hypothetical protein BGO31_04060 [Bacteroidetes bacterium 43-16]